jgi:hypothetical protein
MRITTRVSLGILCAALVTLAACSRESSPPYRTFPTPEDAVRALISAAATDKADQVVAIFGPDGKELIDNSDPASGRRARQVFSAAAAEGWRLTDREAGGRTLVVGNEEWPFPVPLVRESNGWRFDTAAGREEIISRRIGRNELSVIDTCETYVLAQHIYARDAHDGRPSGVYASVFRSDEGKENGLYWAATRTGKRSPLGDRLAAAAYHPSSQASGQPAAFHGYYFRILTAQGPSAPGGARDYMVNGEMTGGFALVAWPAQYDVTGVMTFIVGSDGIVRQKDLGTGTDAAARAMVSYDPDGSWTPARQ